MAAKTKQSNASVSAFVAAIEDVSKRNDTKAVIAMMRDITGERPKLWGSSIIGFGSYHYVYASGQQGDWPITAVSPRKRNLTIYIMPGFEQYGPLLDRLGKHKLGKSCLYLNKLEDVHQPTLKQLIKRSVAHMRKKYPS